MTDKAGGTMQDLERRRSEALKTSELAVLQHPEIYREVRKLTTYILHNTVDIGEYFPVACKLANLLKTMSHAGKGTIFASFYKSIDPKQCGEARYLRFECRDLMEHFRDLEEWRRNTRCLRVVK